MIRKILMGLAAVVGFTTAATAELNPKYSNQLSTGAAVIPAGTYGEAIEVPENGYCATALTGKTTLETSGEGVSGNFNGMFQSGVDVASHTVAGWFKVDELPASGSYKLLWSMRNDQTSYGGYGALVGSDGKIYVGRTTNDNATPTLENYNAKSSEAVITAGEWCHLALSFEKASGARTATLKVYKNGESAISFDATSNTGCNGDTTVRKFYVGANGISAAGIYIDNAVITDAADVVTAATTYAKECVPVQEYAISIDEDMTWTEIKENAFMVFGDFPENSQITLTIDGDVTITFDTTEALTGGLAFLKIDGEGTCTFALDDSLYTDGCWSKTIFTAPTIVVEGEVEVVGVLKSGFNGAWTFGSTAIALRAQNKEVISINIAGGNAGGTGGDSPAANLVSGSDFYGIAPTVGDSWNNINKQWQSGGNKTITIESPKAYDGAETITRDTMSLSATGKNTWQCGSISNPFLRGYLDDGNGVTVVVHGIPYTKYDVIVYATSDDAGIRLAPVTINGTKYTFNDEGQLIEGDAVWGVGQYATPEIGKNAIRINDCSGEQLTVNAVRVSGTPGGRATICAVQVINQGEIEVKRDYYGEMSGDVVWTDGREDENLEQLGPDWENGSLNTITITNTAANAKFSFGAQTEGMQIKFVSDEDCALTIDAASMVEYGKLGIYDFTEAEGGVTIKLPEGEAFDPSTLPTTIKGNWKFSEGGILVFDGNDNFPNSTYQTLFQNPDAWKGTVWIKNVYIKKDTTLKSCGNSNSIVRVTGVYGWMPNGDQGVAKLELKDEGETIALEISDSSSGYVYSYAKFIGDGTFKFATVAETTAGVSIADVSEFTGKLLSTAGTKKQGKGEPTTPRPIYVGGPATAGTTSLISVADGATINAGCGWEAKSAAFGATLNVKTGEEDDVIVSGLTMQAPVYLGTKVLLPDSQYFSCLGYENDTIKIVSPNEFAIIPGDNATVTEVLGAVAYEEYYYAAEGASVRITYKANEGYIFPNGTDTLVDEITVEGGEEYKPSQTPGKYVAKIDDTCYESLNDAFAAVDDNGKTIFMLQDTAITNGIDLAWNYSWSTTLDMNGKTITPGYNPDKDAFVPMFNVSTNATFTIKGNGTITGWEGALGKEYDSKGVIVVDGKGWLMFKNGTLTAGGQDDKGMYGVAVFGNGTAYFGEQGVEGGPTITTWFAPIGASNLNPGDEGVEIIVYDGAYTQLATPAEEGAWWSPFCAAIHAQADGTYDIKGGAFTGALYSVSTPYANVDQDINFYGGTFEKPLFVGDETGAHPCETPDRVIWKDDAVTLNVEPEGYVWDGRGYLTRKVCVLITAGTELFYDSVEKAFELATDGDTVKLLQNATITNGIDLVYDGGYYWYVTFDLNGKTLSPAYTPTAKKYDPMFNVSSNAYLTIIDSSAKKGGTIAGWEGETAAALDTKAVINVDGGFLYFESGALTAGGVDDCGLYGVYVSGSGSAWFGETNKTENAEGTGPKIETWFAAIGANNLNPGKLGVAIKVYGGEYTQLADGKGTGWAKYCSAIYAPADGTYDIYGGTFNGTVGSIAMPYKDVDQNVNIYAGTFVKTLYVAETETGKSGARYRNIWKDLENKSLILAAPKGYCWDTFGYLQLAIARIKETDMYFKSLQDAFNSVGDGQTVEMLGDIVLTNGIDFVYDEGYAWYTTLDMMGHKLTAQYDREKASNKPVFNVSSNAFVTITGNGTIEGWTGAAAAALDTKAVIDVDGGFLYYLNGTLTAGGVDDCGMYGVNVCGSGKAEFGENGKEGGPTITTWFAPIGANNLTAGTLGVTVTVYGGKYTQEANGVGKWWDYFCSAIYAPAEGTYTIKGGTFNGTVGSIATPYNNVGQIVRIEGGTFEKTLYVGEKTAAVGGGDRYIWKNDEVELDAPTGYEWDEEGYLVKKGSIDPSQGGEIKCETEAEATALAKAITDNPSAYVKAPEGVTGEDADAYKAMFQASASGTTVTLELTPAATNDLQVQVGEDVEAAAADLTNPTKATTTLTKENVTPGMFYFVIGATDVTSETWKGGDAVMAESGKDVTLTKPTFEGTPTQSFYKIAVDFKAPTKMSGVIIITTK